jgi:excisionase family DNA binding protein
MANRNSRLKSIAEFDQILKKEILTFDEASTFLNLSRGYLYKLTHQRKIPFSKPNGKKIYFSRPALESWMMGSPVATQEELDIKASTMSSL